MTPSQSSGSAEPPDTGSGSQHHKPTRLEVLTQLERILADPLFQSSNQLTAFLRFTVESTLAGKSEQLKEYVIGIEVLKRGPTYNPREDPAVRIVAGRLRSKLAEYYQGAGQPDPVLIELLRGGYSPNFERRGNRTPTADSVAPGGDTSSSGPEASLPAIARRPLRIESTGGIREAPVERKATVLWFRWGIAAALVVAALGGGAWRAFQSNPQTLSDGVKPSANHEANDQYNLAMNFLAVQNDIPLARKTFKRAFELDPHFASARLQHACMIVIEIFNGYSNDGSLLYQAEEELHQAEQELPGSDGLLLSVQTAVYLAQGRLDRIPLEKLEEQWRNGGNPTWLVILRMLEGQTKEPQAILVARVEREPLEAPPRMFLGELLRTQGDTEGAIHALERVLQQAPANITAAWFLTMAYLDGGKPSQARAVLEGMRPGFDRNYMWRHAWAMLLAAEGKHKEALQAMDESILQFARLTWAVTSTTADFYALQGDHSKAIEWLQLAIARGDERVSYFRRNPRLAALRDDARFQSLLKSVEARRK